jgi:hypothetical protein
MSRDGRAIGVGLAIEPPAERGDVQAKRATVAAVASLFENKSKN